MKAPNITDGTWTVKPDKNGCVMIIKTHDGVPVEGRLPIFRADWTGEAAFANAKLVVVSPKMAAAMNQFVEWADDPDLRDLDGFAQEFKDILLDAGYTEAEEVAE